MLFSTHINHVSVSPTNGNEPTQGQRKTPTRVGIEPRTFGLDHRCSTGLSYKVRREQIVGIEDLKFTALNRVQVQAVTFYANVGCVALVFPQN